MELHDLVEEWVKFSRTDLDPAKFLYEKMHPRPIEIICYHAQQSVEKSLKAFLIKNDIMPPKTHDLNQLCEMCEEIDSSFNEIAAQFGSLNKYSIMLRYPFEIEIFEDETETAISTATKLLEQIGEKLSI